MRKSAIVNYKSSSLNAKKTKTGCLSSCPRRNKLTKSTAFVVEGAHGKRHFTSKPLILKIQKVNHQLHLSNVGSFRNGKCLIRGLTRSGRPEWPVQTSCNLPRSTPKIIKIFLPVEAMDVYHRLNVGSSCGNLDVFLATVSIIGMVPCRWANWAFWRYRNLPASSKW